MPKEVKIDVIDPVHFHGGLPFQSRYKHIERLDISPVVNVYHSSENNLRAFKGIVDKVKAEENGWRFTYYSSKNPLEEMLNSQHGNVLVVACPNFQKIDVIHSAVEAGYELILADKPWVIEPDKIPTLESAITMASEKGTILQDMMTERYEFGTIMQDSIIRNPDLFGKVEVVDSYPTITKSSIHILDKSHKDVVRPPEYFDVTKQGYGIVDVSTHLVDLSLLLLRPDTPVHPRDITILPGMIWHTEIPQENYKAITGGHEIKEALQYMCNGTINYRLDGVWIRIRVDWRLKGKDDTHYSLMEGTNARVEVEKGDEDKHQQVFVTPYYSIEVIGKAMDEHIEKLRKAWHTDIKFIPDSEGRFKLDIPDKTYTSHFDHFMEFTTRAFRYLSGVEIYPREIENSRLLTKYRITTDALKIAR